MGLFSGIGKVLKKASKVVLPAALGYASGGWSGAAAGALSFLGNERTNNANLDIANMTNATSIDLANTAYQRRVKDLSAAGLNPMLAYQQGGAQVPSLNVPTMTNSTAKGLEASAIQAGIAKTKAETVAAETSSEVNSASAAKIRSETEMQNINVQEARFMRDFGEFTDNNIAKRSSNGVWTSKAVSKMYESIAAGNSAGLSQNELEMAKSLNAQARLAGFSTAAEYARSLEIRAADIDFNIAKQNFDLRGFEFNRARAESDAWGSPAGHEILPWSSTAKDVGTTGAAVAVGLRALSNRSAASAAKSFRKGK